jgi:hypothetical protein
MGPLFEIIRGQPGGGLLLNPFLAVEFLGLALAPVDLVLNSLPQPLVDYSELFLFAALSQKSCSS